MGIRQTFEALQQAIAEGDFERIGSYISDDFVLNEPPALPFGGTFRGPDGFVDLIRKITACYDVKPIRSRLTEAGDAMLVCEFVIGFTSRRTNAYVETSVVDLYHFGPDGLVTHVDGFYMDPGKVAGIA